MNENVYKRQWDIKSFTDTSKTYKVSERWDAKWECSCPHWTNRHPPDGCKHIKKVQAALRYLPDSPVFVEAPVLAPKPPFPAVAEFEGYRIVRRELDDVAAEATVPPRRSRTV